jgi:hypothetical protein
MEGEARMGEGKEFHILGADGLKAREPVSGDCAESRWMKQLVVSGAQ